ncbi:hypothetical protein SDC9_110799 [bioreactor metagenome]|uniref:Uncharacterized protein n=1 Tax=bioreactor metagenome TaxID=1076179 RepID=A0A645BEN8_9ZZZZ
MKYIKNAKFDKLLGVSNFETQFSYIGRMSTAKIQLLSIKSKFDINYFDISKKIPENL